MFILVDDEDRENEGDLVIPAQMATPDAINFMAKHGRGLICLTLTGERAEQLRLPSDGRAERARATAPPSPSRSRRARASPPASPPPTARAPSPSPSTRPRAPTTSSRPATSSRWSRATAACWSAPATPRRRSISRAWPGSTPAGVICEIMNDDGTMARMPDLVKFAQRHGLKIGTIDDLIAYRLRNDRIVKRTVRRRARQRLRRHLRPARLRDHGRAGASISRWSRAISPAPGPVLVRVHAVNVLADLLGVGGGGREGSLIEKSMRTIGEEGRGVDRADPRLAAQVGVRMDRAGTPSSKRPGKVDAERRQVEIGVGSQILRDLALATWCCCPTHRPRAMWAWSASACTSSASAG